MYDVRFFRPPNKETATAVIVAVVLLVVVYGVGYMLGLRANVPDHGNGAGTVGEQLGQAENNQHTITAGIQHAEGTVGNIAEAGHAIAGSAENVAGAVSEAGRIIDDCQQILGRVRNRGKKEAPQN